jgi:hypothetical protein
MYYFYLMIFIVLHLVCYICGEEKRDIDTIEVVV